VTPDIEARLLHILDGDARPVQDGLCLWCWLELQGVDLRSFHTSGIWMWVLDWPSDLQLPEHAGLDVSEYVGILAG